MQAAPALRKCVVSNSESATFTKPRGKGDDWKNGPAVQEKEMEFDSESHPSRNNFNSISS